MELHIDIKLAGDGFPTADEAAQIEALAMSIHACDLGPIVDRGAGRGHADIVLRIPSSKQKQAIAEVGSILSGGVFADSATIRVLSERSRSAERVHLPKPGATFVFPVFGSRFGSCRVLRVSTAEEEISFGGANVLVATSSWIGDSIPTPDNPLLRETLILTHHSHKGRKETFWTHYGPPSSYVEIGQIEPSPKEKIEECFVHGGWACAIQVEAQFLWDNERSR